MFANVKQITYFLIFKFAEEKNKYSALKIYMLKYLGEKHVHAFLKKIKINGWKGQCVSNRQIKQTR